MADTIVAELITTNAGFVVSVYQGVLETLGEQVKTKWYAPRGGELL